MSPPVFVTGLPRSRTSWFTTFLLLCGVRCPHELTVESHEKMRSRDDFYRAVNSFDGTCDPYLPWTDFHEHWPAAKIVTIHRSLYDSAKSIMDSHGDLVSIPMHQKWMERAASLPGLHVQYAEIEARIPEICDYLGVEFPREDYKVIRGLNVQDRRAGSLLELFNVWGIDYSQFLETNDGG